MLLEVIPIHGNVEEKRGQLESQRKKWLILKEEAKNGVKPIIKENPQAQVQVSKNPLMKNVIKT